MIYIKNNLIIGIVSKAIGVVFKAIYKVLSLFNLQPFLFTGILGLILLLTGVFNDYPIIKYVFFVLLFLSVAYAFIRTFYKIIPHKKKDGKNVQIVNEIGRKGSVEESSYLPQQNNQSAIGVAENDMQVNPSQINQRSFVQSNNEVKPKDSPKYYTVRQNSNYIFAEYNDRYELFLKTPNGLKHVRTDRKG